MEINRNNYEEILLDLIEGRLTAEEERTVNDFLRKNPDLRQETEGLGPFILPREDHHFPGKDQLKRSIPGKTSIFTVEQFDLFSIARMEGDLTPEQENAHDLLLESSDQLREEWEQWKRTRLQPTPVSFGNKKLLRKRSPVKGRLVWITSLSSAAAVALLVILLGPFHRLNRSSEQFTQSGPDTERAPALHPDQPIREDPVRTAELLSGRTMEGRPPALAKAGGDPVLFSIRRNTDREIPADTAGNKQQAIPEKRETSASVAEISRSKFARHTPLQPGQYDRIQPFPIPAVGLQDQGISLERLAGADLQELFDSYTEEGGMTLLTVANYGLKGINLLTGSELSLMASRDEEGEVSGIRLKSRRFSFAAPLDLSE